MNTLPGSMPSVFGTSTGARMVSPFIIMLLKSEDRKFNQKNEIIKKNKVEKFENGDSSNLL